MSKKVISTSSDTVRISSDSHIDIVTSSGQTGMEESQSTSHSLENLNIDELYPYDENIQIASYLVDEGIINTMENDASNMYPSHKENARDIITDSEEKVRSEFLVAGVDASCKDIPLSKLCAEKLNGSPLNLETMCNVCKEIFECKMKLEDHYLMHEEFHETYCRICHSEIDKHKKIKGRSEYHCCECGLETAKRSHLKCHLYIHSPLKLFKCEYCEERFKQTVNLRIHIKKLHLVCELCGNRFVDDISLHNHHLEEHSADLNLRA